MYANGQGVPQDYALAVQWYRKAADQGYGVAQQDLGLMYANGHGVPQDYVLAHMWCNLATAELSESKSYSYDRAVESLDQIVTKMPSTQIAEAQRLASAWKPTGGAK